MQQYLTTLGDLRGFVMRQRPNIDPNIVRDWANHRLRSIYDRKTWAASIKTETIHIPAAVPLGDSVFTQGSVSVTGTGYPVSDVVNTTLQNAVTMQGLQYVTPVSMTGITEDSILVIDSGANQEVVPVLATRSGSFRVVMTKPHSAGATVTRSSWQGRQIKLGGSHPVFTIRAVLSGSLLYMDKAWNGASTTTGGTVQKMYFNLAPDLRRVIDIVDPAQPCRLNTLMTQTELNHVDPQRTASGQPYALVDYGPNEAGNIMHEIYPPQTAACQLHLIYSRQYPELQADGDRVPSFINPNLLQLGLLADAFMYQSGERDPYFNPAKSTAYERRFEFELLRAMNDDENKYQQALQYEFTKYGMGGGMNWAQTHDVSADSFNGREWW